MPSSSATGLDRNEGAAAQSSPDYAALAALTANAPAPGIDMGDLRLDPDASDIEGNDYTLLGRRDVDGGQIWIGRDLNGVQREVDELTACFSLPRLADKPVMRVFLSSTFRDMAVERTHLIRTIFLRLKRLAREYGITLQEIDLRWGVTAEQVERGETVAICLDEIDRCRDYPPFFIGILGERYGWIPDSDALDALDRHAHFRDTDSDSLDIRRRAREDRLSVAEMEIRYGVLDQPPARRHAFFYTRAPALSELLSRHGGDAGDFFDADCAPMQERLKAELRAAGLLRIDGYRSVLELGEDVERMLGAAILRLARSANAVSTQYQGPVPASLGVNKAIDVALYAERIALARDEALDWSESYRWVCGADLAPRLLLLGAPGSGKRSRARIENLSLVSVPLHCRSAGLTGADAAALYLRGVLHGYGLVPAWDGPARSGLREALEGITERVHIGITDVDLLPDGRDLVALLALVGNRKLCMVLTASDSAYAELAQGFAVRHLGELAMADRHTFIGAHLAGFRKVLAQAEAEQVAALPLSGSPAFLRLLLDELRHGATFETLPALIATYATFGTLDDAYGHALDTWLGYVDPGQAAAMRWRIALETLCLSRYGVPDDFFTSDDGAGLSPLEWSAWLGLADPLVLAVEGGWQWRLPLGRELVVRRYPERSGAHDARRRYCDYLLAAQGRRMPAAIAELTEQLVALAGSGAADDVRRLYDWMLMPDTFRALGSADAALFAQAWRLLLRHGCSTAELEGRALSQDEATALVPLFIELEQWPALEALMRHALADVQAAPRTDFDYQLALAMLNQGRPAEALDVIAPSLHAWMQTREGLPPEAMGMLMAMVSDGVVAFEPWAEVLGAGFAALRTPPAGASPLRLAVLLIAALPLASVMGDARQTLALAHQCILASVELGGVRGRTICLTAAAEAAQALCVLGQFAEAIAVIVEFAGLDQPEDGQTVLQGRCARLMGAALFELERWEDAHGALAFAWQFEAQASDDASIAVGISAMMAMCLIQLGQVEASRGWLTIFGELADDAPATARQMFTWVEKSLYGAGRQGEAAKLQQRLAALPE